MVPDPAKQKQRKPKCLSMAGVKKDLSLSYTHKKDLVFPECGFWPTRSGFRPEDCILRSSRGIWMEAAGLLSVLWAGSPQSKECQKHSKTVGAGYVWRLWSRRTSPKVCTRNKSTRFRPQCKLTILPRPNRGEMVKSRRIWPLGH